MEGKGKKDGGQVKSRETEKQVNQIRGRQGKCNASRADELDAV